jgi:hypothetical protein
LTILDELARFVNNQNRQVTSSSDPRLTLKPNGFRDEIQIVRGKVVETGPPTAVIDHQGIQLVLRFAAGDRLFEGDPVEIRLLPGEEPLTLPTLRRFAPNAELYLALVRAAISTIDPKGQADLDRFHRAAAALREHGGPRRGHRDEFFQQIALEYNALVEAGEPHPVKTLAARHHVVISAASRWLKEARRRGHLNERNN